MRTFHMFCEDQAISGQFDYAINLLAEANVDPFLWVLQFAKINYPMVEATMQEEYAMLLEGTPPQPQLQTPGFMDTAKQVMGTIGNYIAGPQRRFQLAAKALGWLKNSLAAIQGKMGKPLVSSDGTPLTDWITKVIEELQKQVAELPKLVQTYSMGNQNVTINPQGQHVTP